MREDSLNQLKTARLPNISAVEKFVDEKIAYDLHVKQSFADGYMTRDDMIIAHYIKTYCDINEEEDPEYDKNDMDLQMETELGENPTIEEIRAWREKHPEPWDRNFPQACEAAAKYFKISSTEAKRLYERGLEVRKRIIDR